MQKVIFGERIVMKGVILNFHDILAAKLSLDKKKVTVVLDLFEQGATIPFVARYRKELSGGMDEVVLTSLRDLWFSLQALEKRRKAIISSLEERNLLTEILSNKIKKADSLTILEDIYLPYKPKRKTRASKAIAAGLEELSDRIFLQENSVVPSEIAQNYISEQFPDADSVLGGARDIIAERISVHSEVRALMRKLFLNTGFFNSKVIKGKEEQGERFKDWFAWSEKVSTAPSHRILAMRRGEKELFLNLSIQVDEERALAIIKRYFPVEANLSGEQVLVALIDGYKRLLAPQMETEIRLVSKEKADTKAILVFATNLRELLMAAPLGGKRLMAIDPGFRTGCKTVCLDEQGVFLEYSTIFPHSGSTKATQASQIVSNLILKHKIDFVAIGNGTAGRETEQFLRKLNLKLPLIMVNESGASIYSASQEARDEFSMLDLTVRGAISIGRRLQDPLAELVKIDPGSIGVGQYQHDVNQKQLRQSLDDTVISCVNSVGVNLNMASSKLLSYVSGLSASKARAIKEYREIEGQFVTREDLKKVAGIGNKAFQQCAGFLRITESLNPLDSSAVHPESYSIVQEMAKSVNTDVAGLMKEPLLRKQIILKDFVSETVGLPTLLDIREELGKPGRDPRKEFEHFDFADVHSMDDLTKGLQLPGIVTNVTAFGAFVDIGVHTDGLVHVSKLSRKWISNPSEVVHVGMKVTVTVTEIEKSRKRISLSMI